MKLKTYVGRSLEELAPQIREELGPSAVILSQRQGLKGGVGGFFGTKSIEVLAADRVPTHEQTEAMLAGNFAAAEAATAPAPAPTSTIDDERAALVATALGEVRGRQMPASQAAAAYSGPVEELSLPDFAGSIGPVEPAIVTPVVSPAPVEQAVVTPVVSPGPVVPTMAEPIVVEHRVADDGMHLAPRHAPEAAWHTTVSHEAFAALDELDRAGVAGDIASAIVNAAERSLRPIHPEALLRDLLRARIRAILRVEAGWGGEGRRTIAVVGPSGAGKTTAVLKLAERYAAAGLSVGVLALDPGRDTQVGGRGRVIDALDESRAFDLRRAGRHPRRAGGPPRLLRPRCRADRHPRTRDQRRPGTRGAARPARRVRGGRAARRGSGGLRRPRDEGSARSARRPGRQPAPADEARRVALHRSARHPRGPFPAAARIPRHRPPDPRRPDACRRGINLRAHPADLAAEGL